MLNCCYFFACLCVVPAYVGSHKYEHMSVQVHMRAGAYGDFRLTLGVLLGHSSPSSPRHDLLIKSIKPTLFEPGILASPFLQDPMSVFQAPGLQLDPDTQLTFSVCYWGYDPGPYACMCYKY